MSSGVPFAMSIVMAGGRARRGRLQSLSASEAIRLTTEALAAANCVSWAIGAIDISLNDDKARHRGVNWQLQIYLVGSTANNISVSQLSKLMRQHIGRVQMIARPVKVRPFDRSRYGISYVLKTMFVRRVAYRSEVRGALVWNTRKVTLHAHNHVELLLFLDRLGLTHRLLFFRIRGRSSSDAFQLARRPSGGF